MEGRKEGRRLQVRELWFRRGVKMAKNKKEEDDTDKDSEAPDGGWGWVVAAGVFLIALVVPMLSPSFGILFSRQLLEWRASSTTVAVVYNAFMVVWRVTGVMLGSLTREFGYRKVAMTGTLLTALCLTLSALAASPTFLLLSFSLGCGLGSGLSCVGYLILAQYFHRRRGLANAWLMAGAGMGHFFSPLLIRCLQDQYGLQGAIIIVGAIILHGFLGATVFHPVEWHCKHVRPGEVATSSLLSQEKYAEVCDRDTKSDSVRVSEQERTQYGNDSNTDMSDDSESYKECDKSASSFCPSANDDMRGVPCPATLTDQQLLHSDDETTFMINERSEPCGVVLCHTVMRVIRSVISDMAILRRPSCLIIALGSTFIVNGEANFTVMVPFAIQAAGHSLQTAAWCVSVAGICSFCSRLLVSPMSDMPWFNMRLCYMAAIATMGVSIIVFTFQTSAVWQAGVMGVWGVALGTFYGLNNLLMTRIIGLDRLTSIYSAKNFLVALGFFSIGPFVGVTRDVSGSYAISMWVLAALIIISFVLWLFMPAAVAHDRRIAATHRDQEGAAQA